MRKLPVLCLISACAATVSFAQKAPEKVEKTVRPEVWTFEFQGGGYIGVETREVTSENFSKYGLSEVRGVVIEKVRENSPASEAGLQPGDVIVKFDGEKVSSGRKLQRLVGEVAPDHKAQLTIIRGGVEQEITVTVGRSARNMMFDGNLGVLPKMSEMPRMPQLPETPRFELKTPDGMDFKIDSNTAFYFGSNRQIGINVASLTKQLGEYFGVADGKGVLITNVRDNGPAAKAGLKAGDVIVAVDNQPVGDNWSLVRSLNNKTEGEVEIAIIRDRARQTIRVTPEKGPGITPKAPLMPEPSGTVRPTKAIPPIPIMPGATRVL